MKVLIADKFEKSGIDGLNGLGCEVVSHPELDADTLATAAATVEPDIIVVRSTKVKEPVFKAVGRLSIVIRAGAGYDNIDVSAASARGVFVATCPGKNSVAVAELVWAHILACDRRVPDQTADLRAGRWNKKEYSRAAGLFGRTLGIIGLGQIGREVAKRGRAFGMNVVAWSRSLTPAAAEHEDLVYCAGPLDVARTADVISVNVASTDDTKHLVNKAFCDAMKRGAIFVNTSRGGVVDEESLAAAIRDKGVRAGLDVFQNEPAAGQGEFACPIARLPGVTATHHIGASTDQAQEAIAAEAVRIVDTFRRTGQVINCVNLAKSTPATNLLTIRMLNKPGVLAHVFYILGQAGINVEVMDNIVYEGAKAACAHIQVDEQPNAEHLNAIRANPNVLSVAVARL